MYLLFFDFFNKNCIIKEGFRTSNSVRITYHSPKEVVYLELTPLLLLVLGLIIVKLGFLGSIVLIGFIENKYWIKRVGAWLLLGANLICGVTLFISLIIYIIWSNFF